MAIVFAYGEILPLGFGVVQPVDHRVAIPVVRSVRAGDLGNGPVQVYKRTDSRPPLAVFPSTRPTDDQRYATRLFVHAILPPHTVLAHILAVVGCIDHDRIGGNFAVRQTFEDLAYLVVQPLGEPVIKLAALADNV